MGQADLSLALEQVWREITDDAARSNDMDGVLPALIGVYTSLDEQQRLEADVVVVRWALSSNPGKQYDGLGLIATFRIRRAIPALTELLARLDQAEGPSVPYDKARVQRILQQLESAEHEDPPVGGRV